MGWQNNIFPLLIIDASGAFTGLFVYSPAPGPGNLLVSIAAADGTDPYGNAYLATEQIQGGGKLTVGSGTGPEVQLISNAAITITTLMGATGLPASNVTSFSTLQNVIELPSNNINEKSPAIIGQTLITYTGGQTADAVLHLSGTTSTGTFRGFFRLDVGESSGLTFQQAVIEGDYTISGSAVTLAPTFFRSSTGQMGIYNPASTEGSAGIAVNSLAGFTDGSLVPATFETWHSVTPGNGWVNTIWYKLTSDNEVYLWSNSLTAPAAAANGVTIITLPTAYIPNVNMQINIGALANAGVIPHLTLSNTGTLQSTGVQASSGVFLNARVPLDLP